MNQQYRRGSALVLVMVASMFLIILTAGAFRYFKTNIDVHIWTRDRIQAKLAAEAGINLASHKLAKGGNVPSAGMPEPIVGTENSYFVLPDGLGSVYVTVDPSENNGEVTTANAYMMRSIAFVGGGSAVESFGIESIVMPLNLARFATFLNKPDYNYYLIDGYRYDGPFFVNGPMIVGSQSISDENDPFFYSFQTTADYYMYTGNARGGDEEKATLPAFKKLRMRPYERMCLGAPYFELGADPIPFGESETNWRGVRNAAQSGGLYLSSTDTPHGSRLVLKGDTLFVKKTAYSLVDTYYLGGLAKKVLWIENTEFECVYLRGSQLQGLDMALTIGTIGDIYIAGNLMYEDMDLQDQSNTDMLGLMTVKGDFVIAIDPGAIDSLWGGESFQIATDDTLTYCAALLTLSGAVKAERVTAQVPMVEFLVVGGVMANFQGGTSLHGTIPVGYSEGIYFDPRLFYSHPPFFPTTGTWITTMWADKADMTVSDVTNGIPLY